MALCFSDGQFNNPLIPELALRNFINFHGRNVTCGKFAKMVSFTALIFNILIYIILRITTNKIRLQPLKRLKG